MEIADQVDFADTAVVAPYHTEVSDVVGYMMQFVPELVPRVRQVSREWYWGCIAYLQSTEIIAKAKILHQKRKLWLKKAPTTVRGALMATRLHERRTFIWYYPKIKAEKFPIRDCLAMLLGNPQQSFEECYRMSYGIGLYKHITVDNFESLLREYYAVGDHDPDQVKIGAGILMYCFNTCLKFTIEDSEKWLLSLISCK